MLFIVSNLEPIGRIELPSTVYETVALPLSYIGLIEERLEGIGPSTHPWEGYVLPLNYSRNKNYSNMTTILD